MSDEQIDIQVPDPHAAVEQIDVEVPQEDEVPGEGELAPDDDYVEGVDADEAPT